MTYTEITVIVLNAVIYISWIKHLMGYHWPWEKCLCCGKRYSEHKQS